MAGHGPDVGTEPPSPRGAWSGRLLAWGRRYPLPLWLLGAATFFGYSSFFLLVVALPLYFRDELGFDVGQIGIVIGATYVLNVVVYVAVGIYADRIGTVVFVVLGPAGVGSAALLFLWFDSLLTLAAVAVWHGLTMSAYSLAATALAGTVATEEHRGAQMGLYGLFHNSAIALSPPLGVLLLLRGGPGILFWTAFACGFASGALGITLRRYERSREAATRVRLSRWLRGFPSLWKPSGVVAAMGVGFGVVLAFMPLHLSEQGIGNPGLYYSTELVTLILLRTLAGRLSDLYGRETVAAGGLLFAALSLALLFVATNFAGVLVAGIVGGAGWAFFAPSLLAWLFDRTTEDRRGLASAAYFTALDAGRVAGTVGLGFLAGLYGPALTLIVAAGVTGLVGLTLGGAGLHALKARRRAHAQGT